MTALRVPARRCLKPVTGLVPRPAQGGDRHTQRVPQRFDTAHPVGAQGVDAMINGEHLQRSLPPQPQQEEKGHRVSTARHRDAHGPFRRAIEILSKTQTACSYVRKAFQTRRKPRFYIRRY